MPILCNLQPFAGALSWREILRTVVSVDLALHGYLAQTLNLPRAQGKERIRTIIALALPGDVIILVQTVMFF